MTVKCLKTECQTNPRETRTLKFINRARDGQECYSVLSHEWSCSPSSKDRSRSFKIPAFNKLEHSKSDLVQKSFAHSDHPNVSDPEMARKDLGTSVDNRSRALLTRGQAKILETYFQLHPKPNSMVKKQLAMETNLSLCRVSNWFQNRRAKAKQQRKQQYSDYVQPFWDNEHNREINDRQKQRRSLRQIRSCRCRDRSSDVWNDDEISDTSFQRSASSQTFAILLYLGSNLSQQNYVTDQVSERTGMMQQNHENASKATYVVFRENNTDQTYVPLWKRFSRTTRGGKYRHGRCKPADVEDYLGWLSWQQHGLPGTPSRYLKSPNWYSNSLPTANEISNCRKVLLETVSKLSSPSDRYLVRILYIVAMSFSEINVMELYTALSLASTVDERNYSCIGPRITPVQLVEMLRISSDILKIDSEEIVSFHDPAMRDFLIKSELSDFETGHLMMGHIYLQLLEESGLPNVIMPWLNFQEWYLQARDAPLADYMARYGTEHCRQAQQIHPEFCGDIHRSLLKGCSGSILPENSNEVLTVNAQWAKINLCYEASIIYDFSELATAYEEMGASLDHERAKILPETLTMTSLTQSDAIYALSSRQNFHSDQLPKLQFRARPMCSERKNGDVEKLEDALQTMDLSTERISFQEEILADTPNDRSESITTIASKLQSSYGSWLARLGTKQPFSANLVSSSYSPDMPTQTDLSDSDDSDWEVIECRVCQN